MLQLKPKNDSEQKNEINKIGFCSRNLFAFKYGAEFEILSCLLNCFKNEKSFNKPQNVFFPSAAVIIEAIAAKREITVLFQP